MLFIPTRTSKLKPILEYYVETVSIRKRSYCAECISGRGIVKNY